MENMPGIPNISVDLWPDRPMSEKSFKETLALFAYRAKIPVAVKRFEGEFLFSPNRIHIYVRRERLLDTTHIPGSRIHNKDDELLAIVHHNCILILPDITGDYGQNILADTALKCLEHLDFSRPQSDIERERTLGLQLKRCADSYARDYLEDKRQDMSRLQAEIDDLSVRLAFSAGQMPRKRGELRAAQRLAKRLPHTVEHRELKRIRQLMDSGLYESVRLMDDGAVQAETAEIVINYDGYIFPLGKYRILLTPPGRIIIDALDNHPFADHPHPHVATDGRACLGNIHNTVSRLLGAFRIGEALQLLHDFLRSYSPDNPYERIGSFDPDQMYRDEDECEDCDDRSAPYCICQCEINEGRFEIEDCYDYRTEYCYMECSHRGNDCADLSPCDDCNESRNCFTDCAYNEKWTFKEPCQECENDGECDECEYAERARELGREIHAAEGE